MKAKPTVSVIIPTFNRARALRRAVSSVLQQTCPDFELLLVDDCSDENIAEVVHHYNDPRIELIRHSRRKGGSAARNTGIRIAKGDYVAFLDSDDEWYPNKLEKQLHHFNKCHQKIGLIYAWLIHYQNNHVVSYSRSDAKGNVYKKLLLNNVISGTSSVMVRKNVFSLVKGFDEDLPARQDMDLWVRIAKFHDVDYIPEILVRVNHLNDAQSISSNKKQMLLARELFFNKHEKELYKNHLSHIYLCSLAHFYYHYFAEKKKFRSYLMRAIQADKFHMRAYALYFLSLLPRHVYLKLRFNYRNSKGLYGPLSE